MKKGRPPREKKTRQFRSGRCAQVFWGTHTSGGKGLWKSAEGVTQGSSENANNFGETSTQQRGESCGALRVAWHGQSENVKRCEKRKSKKIIFRIYESYTNHKHEELACNSTYFWSRSSSDPGVSPFPILCKGQLCLSDSSLELLLSSCAIRILIGVLSDKSSGSHNYAVKNERNLQ